MDKNNSNEPQISKLRELIEQLEKPKASGKKGTKTIFRIDGDGFSPAKNDDTDIFPCIVDNNDNVEDVSISSRQKHVNNATGYTKRNYSDMDEYSAEDNINAADLKNSKGKKRYGRGTAKKTKELEERFKTSNQVYDYALNLLTLRDYSKAEMLERLIKKGAPESFSKEAVAKLLEYNFLNEERYAFRVYEMWLNKRVYGRLHLQAELKKRSIEADCIAKVLAQFTTEIEEQRAEAAATLFVQQNRKKLQELQNIEHEHSFDNELQENTDFSEIDEEESSTRYLRKKPKKTSKWGSRWCYGRQNKAAERMAALKKIQAAAGRFMAARGFSARYMYIVLCKLSTNNDM